jgi:hypothetical protein
VTNYFSNKGEHRYFQAAEDAFTSEGGRLDPDEELHEARAGTSVNGRVPDGVFKRLVDRYATGMKTASLAIRDRRSRHAARTPDPTVP